MTRKQHIQLANNIMKNGEVVGLYTYRLNGKTYALYFDENDKIYCIDWIELGVPVSIFIDNCID